MRDPSFQSSSGQHLGNRALGYRAVVEITVDVLAGDRSRRRIGESVLCQALPGLN